MWPELLCPYYPADLARHCTNGGPAILDIIVQRPAGVLFRLTPFFLDLLDRAGAA